MTDVEKKFCIVLLINTAVAIVYVIGSSLVRRKEKKADILMKGIVMFLCPVVGPLFFFAGLVFNKVFFRQNVDLEDVIFSKERVKTHLKADEERERNMVPLEEALAVSDRKNLRMLMLNVIRGDLQESLESITLALDSEDSETSHYAASVLRDELNDFRVSVQNMYTEMKEEKPEETEYERLLIDYMEKILCQKIFTSIEQAKFVHMLAEAGQSLYDKNPAELTAKRYEGICLCLLDLKELIMKKQHIHMKMR